jgi:hypothetical protein
LNHKQRFLRTFKFKEVDRRPDYEFGFWAETIDRWHTEGLSLDKMYDKSSLLQRNIAIKSHFGFDPSDQFESYFPLETVPVRPGFWPTLPGRVIGNDKGRPIIDDGIGGIYIPIYLDTHYLRYPLKNRDDWEKFKPFFDPDTPGRFPLNWDEVIERCNKLDYPLGIRVGGLYGWLRNWMGVEKVSIAFHRDPDWIAEMMDTLVNLWIKIIRRALKSVKVDFSEWWEDMCYNKGPMISVRHFEEFMVPRYKKVTNVLKEYGVEINILDCDGNISLLIPGWLKSGINCMFPMEMRCNDFYRYREKFGRKLLLMGGVNKYALIEGVTAIDKELERLTPLLQQGGYIPMVDHGVPPEVSLANFKYYLKKKREWIGKTD